MIALIFYTANTNFMLLNTLSYIYGVYVNKFVKFGKFGNKVAFKEPKKLSLLYNFVLIWP